MSDTPKQHDWTKPAAMAIPKGGFLADKVEQGRYGPIFPKTPACYGFTIIAKIKPGSEETVRSYGKKIEETIGVFPRPSKCSSCITCAGCSSTSTRRPT